MYKTMNRNLLLESFEDYTIKKGNTAKLSWCVCCKERYLM